jgi:hypothetical protein
MAIKNCDFCDNEVPMLGQCNSCGFLDGFKRQPSEDEFRRAWKINEEHNYKQYENIDMLLLKLD